MPLIETKFSHAVMTITLNDEPRRNALSRQLLGELLAAVEVAENEREVRVVVLTNHGSVFCAGANLAEQSSTVNDDDDRPTVALSELFVRIRNATKPFVGRINGHCVAGGVGLAAVMDISVAVDAAMFSFSEVRLGVAPAIISVVCLPKMGRADAQAAFLRGNRFPASEARRMGLINYVAAPRDIDAEVAAIVHDLLQGEPHAIAAAKRLTTVVPSMAIDEAFTWTAQLSAELFRSDEAREGMAAFLAKRPASWLAHDGADEAT